MIRRIAASLSVAVLFPLFAFPVRAGDTSVKAVLFYNPNCGVCTYVMNEVLPPIIQQYGNNFQVLPIDITRKDGASIYQAAIDALSIPVRAVPLLVIEDTYLVGSEEISDRLPEIIEDRLSKGGTEWPSLPGMDKMLQQYGFSVETALPWHKFMSDQPGNSLAVIVLAVLVFSLIFSILITFLHTPTFLDSLSVRVFPLLLVIGLVVASYLTYTELTQSHVACGGVSNCTAVQNSPYSKLLGLISIGEFGVLGYLLMGICWLVHRIDRGWVHAASAIVMFGFAVFGVGFSTYLTFLEPFVIGSTCLWCLTSAVIMALLLPLTTIPVRGAISQQSHPAPHTTAE